LYGQFLRYEAELKQKAALFIAVSGFIRQKLLERGYPADRIVCHAIGVDPTRFSPSPSRPSQRYVLSVGRHTEKKGIATLLKAFAGIAHKYPEVKLIQVGTGKLTAQLTQLADCLGIAPQVNFLGSQPHTTVQRLMQGAEVFALASQTATDGDCEGLPIVLNEASACGIPIVSTWHSGIPEAVKDGETGYLVAERDDAALGLRLDHLLGEPGQARAMGQRGRAWIEAHFDIRKQSQLLERHYDALV
jgi:glycosyltransferase involved in cell wall biosynthesis